MTKIRRGGHVFVTWKGDHSPRHVYVFHRGRLIVKWDLEGWRPLAGTASRRVRRLLERLVAEGLL